MNIVMLYPGLVENLPPLITAAQCMAENGASINILALGCANEVRRLLSEFSITVHSLNYSSYPKNYLGKIGVRSSFYKAVTRHFSTNFPEIVWYHDSYSMEYNKFLRVRGQTINVAHVHELHDRELVQWQILKSFLKKAQMFLCPEINRAWLLRYMCDTNSPFFVVPNRPREDMFKHINESPEITKEIFVKYGGSGRCNKFIIYQGLFSRSRCLLEAIKGFHMVRRDDVGFILMGEGVDREYSQSIAELARPDKRIVILPRMVSPSHFQVTKGCTWGVMLYAPRSLNDIYCAPNKIYEYTNFGLGIIMPDFPGISSLNDQFRIGSVCNPLDPMAIAKSFDEVISRDPFLFKESCKKFLEATCDPKYVYRDVYTYLTTLLKEKHLLC